MSIEIFDSIKQGTAEWLAIRAGIITASEMQCLLMQGRGAGESKTRRKYMLRLIAEQLSGLPEETYSNQFMERGKKQEEDARNAYTYIYEVELQRVGFIRNGKVGCSPDALVGTDGALELKTRLGSLQIELLLSGEVPPEHSAQLQGVMWVAERAWIDFVAYSPGLRPFIRRVHRNERAIAEMKVAVDTFLEEMEAIKRKLQA